MSGKKQLILFLAISALFGFLASLAPASAASNEKVLYGFCSVTGCPDGQYPNGNLIFDAAGNLYGTTTSGGTSGTDCDSNQGCGTVFKLTKGTHGEWSETVLYNFCTASTCVDGAHPSSGLIFDTAGNLYGVTSGGGSGQLQRGTIFELAPLKNGKWSETVIYSFCSVSGCTDGFWPFADLIFDPAGNLYGTASGGGAGGGVVFQLKTDAKEQWQEKVLHTFCTGSGCVDGSTPYAGLVFDMAGNLYGTTSAGGAHNLGTVFRLALGTNGKWKEKVLHSFKKDGKDGYLPAAGLILDGAGDLFGTTYSGGGDRPRGCRMNGCGTVFELMQNTKGKWTEKILTTWGNNRRDGKTPANPGAALVFDAKGNLYGTTVNGGAHHIGTVFRLTTAKNGNWKQTVLHSFEFDGQDADAMNPATTLLLDSAGHLYGTSPLGGTYGCNGKGCGTVFKITP